MFASKASVLQHQILVRTDLNLLLVINCMKKLQLECIWATRVTNKCTVNGNLSSISMKITTTYGIQQIIQAINMIVIVVDALNVSAIAVFVLCEIALLKLWRFFLVFQICRNVKINYITITTRGITINEIQQKYKSFSFCPKYIGGFSCQKCGLPSRRNFLYLKLRHTSK